MRNLYFKIFGLAIGLGVLFWLINKTGTREILHVMKEIEIRDVVCALFLIFCGIYLRALRWRCLFLGVNGIRGYPFFSAIMIGALANNILPARGGDLVRVYMLGKNTQLSKSSILATVLIERLSELLVLCFMSVLVLSTFPVPQWIQNGALLVGGVSFFGLLVLVFLSKNTNSFFSLCLKLFSFLPQRITSFLEPIVREFMYGIRGVLSGRSFFLFITLTILIWGSELGILWFFAKSLGFTLSFFESWVVMIYAVLAYFVPLLPAQIGVLEFAIQSSMAFLGYEGPATLAFGILWHFTLLLVGSIGGIVCLFLNGNSLFTTYTTAQRAYSD